MVRPLKLNLVLLLIIIFLSINWQNAVTAKEADYNQLKKVSYKVLAEAFYGENTYDKYRIEMIDILGKLADETGNSYKNGGYDNSDIFKTVRTMLTAVTESLNKKRKDAQPQESTDVEEKVEQILSKGDAAVAYMLGDALKDPDYTVQLYAASAILKVNNKEAAPIFINLLESDKTQDQLVGLLVLSNIKDKNAVAPIIKILEEEKTPLKLKIQALHALQNIDDTVATKASLNLIESPENALRYTALNYLINQKNKEAIQKYGEYLEDSEEQKNAASYLPVVAAALQKGSLLLINMAYNSDNKVMKSTALGAISKLNNKRPMLKMLEEALNGEDIELRFQAFKVLSTMDEPKALQILSTVEFDRPEFYSKAAKLIVESDNPALENVLKTYLDQGNELVKLAIANYLIQQKDNKVFAQNLLSDLVKSDNEDISYQAALTMVASGNLEPIKIVRELLDSKNPKYKARAVIILAKAGDKSVIPFLEKSVADINDYKKSYGAALLLYNLGEEQYEDVLIKYFSQRKINSLNEDFVDVEFFKGLLNNPNPLVRLNAARVLLEAGETGSLEVVKKEADNKDVYVKAMTAKLLGEYGKIEDIILLENMINDDYVRVRVNASEAILRILNRQDNELRS
jgi:HEAT repeat protein